MNDGPQQQAQASGKSEAMQVGECTGVDPCKAAADDDHIRCMTQLLRWRFKLQEVMVARHVHSNGFIPKGLNRNLGWLF